ncbi:MAG: bifunctional adenosylcobinamide kinase/adenosylcobinamide-phosphate guanylyltransferase [Desulfobacterales bacterium]|nr:bifunctional adenosylcobinamide kinase/adenosylcobinamide-phosphate guanylyltransferase [Desulfobacterales bacterium]
MRHRLTFVIGGCRSGKSRFALETALRALGRAAPVRGDRRRLRRRDARAGRPPPAGARPPAGSRSKHPTTCPRLLSGTAAVPATCSWSTRSACGSPTGCCANRTRPGSKPRSRAWPGRSRTRVGRSSRSRTRWASASSPTPRSAGPSATWRAP